MKPILLKELIGKNEFDVFAKTVLAENCPVSWDGLNRRIPLFRGTSNQTDYTLYDPKTRNRKARDTHNFSLLFTETLESWKSKGIPARRHSVIFSNSKVTAGEYGERHWIFFEGDPIISYGDASDNYSNYSRGFIKSGLSKCEIGSVDALDEVISKFFYYFKGHQQKEFEEFSSHDHNFLYHATTPEEIAEFVEKLDNSIGRINADEYRRYVDDQWGLL